MTVDGAGGLVAAAIRSGEQSKDNGRKIKIVVSMTGK